MGRNLRTESNRPERPRGARYQTGRDRDRYRTGGEQRYSPDDRERDRRGFEGDHTYHSGGYSEEFGYRGDRENDSYEGRSSWDYRNEPPMHEHATDSFGRGRGPASSGSAPGAQSFRGLGPRGYRRSDERLMEIVCDRLTDDPRIDASDVTVEVHDRTVTLTGSVSDRVMKYEIEDLVEGLGGVKDLDNRLRVRSSPSRFGPSSDAPSRQQDDSRDWQPGMIGTKPGEMDGPTPGRKR